LDLRRAEDGVVVSHDGEALRAGDCAEGLRTAVHGAHGKGAGQRGEADKVSGQEHQVRGKRVDPGENAADEGGLRVLVVVDVADLDDTEVVEGVGQIADGEGLCDHAELVAGDFSGIEGQTARCRQRGADQKLAAGDGLVLLCQGQIGQISGHSP